MHQNPKAFAEILTQLKYNFFEGLYSQKIKTLKTSKLKQGK